MTTDKQAPPCSPAMFEACNLYHSPPVWCKEQRCFLSSRSGGDPCRVPWWHPCPRRDESHLLAERQRHVEALGIPARCWPFLFDDLPDTAAIVAVRQWATKREGGLLVLCGRTGTGKTIAAAWWLVRSAAAGRWRVDEEGGLPDGGWVSAALLRRMDAFKGVGYGRAIGVPYLVLDDLGAESGDVRGYWTARLDEVLSERHAHMRPTIATSNLRRDALLELLGDRIGDRLREAGGCIEIIGPSLRAAAPAPEEADA